MGASPLNRFFQHPTGQIPAYERNFSDVNPPVHTPGPASSFTGWNKRSGERVICLPLDQPLRDARRRLPDRSIRKR